MEPTLHQLFFRAFHGQNNLLQPVREELGLGRGQPRILTFLLRRGQSSQSEIASYFQTDPASISRMTEILRQNGFLTRIEDESCRRANKVCLTKKGRSAALRWLEVCAQVDATVLSGFSEDEVKLLKGMLSRILDNLGRSLSE